MRSSGIGMRPEELALRRDDVDAGRNVERFAGAALDGDAGRDPEVAVHVELHAVAAAALAEIVDEALLGQASRRRRRRRPRSCDCRRASDGCR